MKISNIQDYTGGASAISAREYVDGTKFRQQFSYVTETPGQDSDTPKAIGYIDIDYAFAKASVSYSRNQLTINSLELISNDQDFRTADNNTGSAITLEATQLPSSAVHITDAAGGKYEVQWPVDLYPGYVPFNTNAVVPVVMSSIKIGDGDSEAVSQNIEVFRNLQFVRYGVNKS